MGSAEADALVVDVCCEGLRPGADFQAVENPLRSLAQLGSDAVDAFRVGGDERCELVGLFDGRKVRSAGVLDEPDHARGFVAGGVNGGCDVLVVEQFAGSEAVIPGDQGVCAVQ